MKKRGPGDLSTPRKVDPGEVEDEAFSPWAKKNLGKQMEQSPFI